MSVAGAVEKLEYELRRIDELIEAAAVEKDVPEWTKLRMRRDALPRLMAEAKAAPIHEQIARLQEELEDLERDRQRTLEEPAPVVPDSQRGSVTGLMLRNGKLSGIAAQMSRVGRELDQCRRALVRVESEGIRSLE